MTGLEKSGNGVEGSNFLSTLMGLYVILVCMGVPLIIHDKYFDILTTKYYFYCGCTMFMIVIFMVYYISQWHKKQCLTIKDIIGKISYDLSWTDYSVLLFYIIAILSTLSSDYVYESFWGNEGRFTGLFLITWYVLSYFCISRFWKFNVKYIDIIVLTGILVCLFGITDYFNLDILNFKQTISDSQRNIFTSTIGNINTYTAYVGIIAAISTVLFSTEKYFKKMLYYFISMIISFFAIIMGTSDNAYLSLGALFGFLPLFLFKDNKGIKRYIIVIATFLTVIKAIVCINDYFADVVLGIDSTFKLMVEIKGFVVLIILLWIFVITWYMVDCRKKNNYIFYGNTLRNLWIVLLITIFIGIVYVLYDCNIVGDSDKYGSLTSYLLFNDDWGTHRGYIWRNAMECYFNMSWWKKAVGFGPETFGILMLQKTAHNPYNEVFDSAHNEYLHLLTTVGIFGLISYLSFVIGVIVHGIKHHINKPYIVAVLFGIICYSIQAFVNLNLPIVTPVFWALLGIVSSKSIDG